MIRRPPISILNYTLCPNTTLFRASSPRSYGTGICLQRRRCSEPAGAASADRLSLGRCRCRPLTPGFVRDAGIAEKLADIGVILLIFCTGPHFSAKDLFSAGRIANPGAIVKP